MTQAAALRRAIAQPAATIVPGVYDALSVKLVERAGFSCAYVTGAGVSMAGLGLPDIGLASFGEILDRLEVIAGATELPVIADGDTGYGGVLNVARTVRQFERRGAAGIQLEDQVFPKRCGHEAGRRCIPVQEMIHKLAAALDSRNDDDFVVIARTDARTSEGIDAAIDRARAYAAAGADVVFVESPESVAEMRRICVEVPAPTMANMVEGGRTPLLSAAELTEIGYVIALFPNSVLRAVARRVEQFLTDFRAIGDTRGMLADMYTHKELFELFGYPEWADLEDHYLRSSG